MKPKVAQKVIPLETPVHPPSWGIVPNKFSLFLSRSLALSRSLSLSLALALSLSRMRTLSLSWTTVGLCESRFRICSPGPTSLPSTLHCVAYNLELYPYSKALN